MTLKEEQPRFGKWSEPGVPHRGWQCTAIEDLGAPVHECEMCETAMVRYVHLMEHDDHPPLEVGCICAGNMEQNLSRARQREAECRNRSQRRRNWLSRSWRVSGKGNEFLNADGFNVVVFHNRDGWSARIAERSGYESGPRFLRRHYPTSDAAKLAAFDLLSRMRGQMR